MVCTFLTSGGHLEVQKWSDMRRFVHFDFQMCFAPQRNALFRHLNCQKCFGTEVPCIFSLANAVRAKTAWAFSTSSLTKVVRTHQFCHFLLQNKCASRHNGVQFFIVYLASLQNIGKTQCFATFLPFRTLASSLF